MDTSGSEDEDFISRRCRGLSPVHPKVTLTRDLDDSGPVTPPTDHSINFKSSLGLILTPQSPPYRKVRSMKLMESPKSSFINRLELPFTSSTPAASPLAIKIPRSLRAQRHKSKYDFNDRLNVTTGNAPSSLVNPFSPYRCTQQDDRQLKKSRMEKKKIVFNSDDEDETLDDILQKNLKKPKLSDFDCLKFEKEFMVLGVLGSGDHGCVYKCLHLLTGMEYAVKRSLRPVNNEKVARNEIFAHAALVHPHIVSNYVSWTEDDYVFMQNEYCNGGSLEEHIKNNEPMQEKELMILLEHLAQGLWFIHRCNLAHMDIKPGNIFLKNGPELYYKHHNHSDEDDSKEETTYKIGDLGHVIKRDNSGYVEDGDCRYLPREMLNDKHLDYSKVDIFAFGLTLYETAGGGPLPKNGEEWHKIRDGHIKTFPHLSTQFNNILKRMIDSDPKKRPSACELLDEMKCRDETMDRELKAANQKIHLLEHQISDIVKTVSKSVNGNSLRTPPYKKHTMTTERFTRSTSRLIAKKTPKSSNCRDLQAVEL